MATRSAAPLQVLDKQSLSTTSSRRAIRLLEEMEGTRSYHFPNTLPRRRRATRRQAGSMPVASWSFNLLP